MLPENALEVDGDILGIPSVTFSVWLLCSVSKSVGRFWDLETICSVDATVAWLLISGEDASTQKLSHLARWAAEVFGMAFSGWKWKFSWNLLMITNPSETQRILVLVYLWPHTPENIYIFFKSILWVVEADLYRLCLFFFPVVNGKLPTKQTHKRRKGVQQRAVWMLLLILAVSLVTCQHCKAIA